MRQFRSLLVLLGTLLCVAVTVGLFDGTGRSMAIGLVAAIFGATLWVAIGTALSLLAQIADRR